MLMYGHVWTDENVGSVQQNLSGNISAPDAVRGQVDIGLPVPHRAVAVHGAGGGVSQPGCGHDANL